MNGVKHLIILLHVSLNNLNPHNILKKGSYPFERY